MKTLILIFILLLTTCLYSTIINIPADQPTIQEGIDVSVNADTVLVQPGTYVENINYNGKNITIASLFLTTQDTTYISQTVIDGNENGSVVTFESGEDPAAVLCGFTITNGSCDPYGGGIYCFNSNPSLVNVTITGNFATGQGDMGGGIYCNNSNPSLMNVTISGNSAHGGGGIYCNNSNPSLVDVIILDNSGGGIGCSNSNPSLENVTIIGNSSPLGGGGGVNCWDNSNPSLVNVTITGNGAYSAGGGILCHNSSPSLTNVTISGNSTWSDGGGIYCGSSSPSLVNVTISGNSRVYGGRIDMGAYENQNVIVNTDENLIPLITKLNQNYPNPFNPTTTINYSLKENSKVSINIYNIKGQKVKKLISEQLSSGQHSAIWNGRDSNDKRVSSGIYFYKLKTANFEKTKKMILLK